MKNLPINKTQAQILIFLTINGELRFTELKRKLRDKGLDIPEPTLLMHLNNLIKNNLVEKNILSHKYVTYRAKTEETARLKAATRYLKEQTKAEQVFRNLPPENQIATLIINSAILRLGFLKYQILFEAEGKWEYGFLAEIINSPLFRMHDRVILKMCMENPEYRKAFLEQLEKDLECLVNDKPLESQGDSDEG
ncbi:MAG: hypothetical protein QXL10_01775 [Candidatus Bathyarchaeia archaeon]